MEKSELAEVAVNRIERVFGEYPLYRRAHARGVIYKAKFTANGNAEGLTIAPHLQRGETEAFVRFSHSSPNPEWTDVMSPVKGMAVQFKLPNGKATNIVGVNAPIFFARTPAAFTEMLGVVNSFKDGKPPLRELAELLIRYPESRAAIKILKKMHAPVSFATGIYYSMHAFYFLDQEGKRTPIKYEWMPDAGIETLDAKDLAEIPAGYYEQEIEERVKAGTANFKLAIVLGEADDPTDDPTVEWPRERRRILVGRLKIEGIAEQADGMKFDPTEMPEGILCSEDPILHFRKDAYSISHARRIAEKNKAADAD
ncbi:catalase family peroxidase [Planococcus ruber]|uniref:catalase family peroxidase n=1 Tax=Planococcus ruber TaxID=2027871 RepID=UPI001FF047D6|nr:catalase family peroxidase [Planococcus ruber]MCJ1909606.1 catalase family peroxidase [Planococcus ruber]